MLGDRPSEAKAVVRGRPTAELVDDYEGGGRGTLKDSRRLEHLSHERRDATRLAVSRADALR